VVLSGTDHVDRHAPGRNEMAPDQTLRGMTYLRDNPKHLQPTDSARMRTTLLDFGVACVWNDVACASSPPEEGPAVAGGAAAPLPGRGRGLWASVRGESWLRQLLA
jgi:hypothetical protein